MSVAYRGFLIAIFVLTSLAQSLQVRAITGVVPGKSVGKIRIGESRQDVLTAVRVKLVHTYDLKNSMSIDTWDIRILDTHGSTKTTSISAYYRDDKVIQIELANTDDNSLNIASFNTLIFNNKHLRRTSYNVDCYDTSGGWAGGFVQHYYDDVAEGITYGEGLQDALVLERKPDCIIVHIPGVPVAFISDTAKAKLIKHIDGDIFRTFADQNKYDAAQAKKYQNGAKLSNH